MATWRFLRRAASSSMVKLLMLTVGIMCMCVLGDAVRVFSVARREFFSLYGQSFDVKCCHDDGDVCVRVLGG